MTELGLDLSEGDLEDYSIKCQQILDWAEENWERDFDTDFVETLLIQMADKKFISDRQKAAIDKIISTFDIV